jgi:hypothetical protein
MDQTAHNATLREVFQISHGSQRRVPRMSTAPTHGRLDD